MEINLFKIKSDLINLCEDNENIKQVIEQYFINLEKLNKYIKMECDKCYEGMCDDSLGFHCGLYFENDKDDVNKICYIRKII